MSEVVLCEDPMVLEALRYIKAGARRCLQVEDVADYVCVSRSTLIRRFKQVLCRSVASEIKRQQVEEVKRMLDETGDAIEDISRACGFSSAGQLSRFFKREVGVSPSEWRRGVRVPGEMVAYEV
ncbi:MAG: helix-turn-helix domain-containing protein [Phycisphaeraceae bacterium]